MEETAIYSNLGKESAPLHPYFDRPHMNQEYKGSRPYSSEGKMAPVGEAPPEEKAGGKKKGETVATAKSRHN